MEGLRGYVLREVLRQLAYDVRRGRRRECDFLLNDGVCVRDLPPGYVPKVKLVSPMF